MICPWALNDDLERKYHDEEWGKVNKNETYLFEMLCLEGMQAGLSWRTILHKRDEYRRVYYNFDYHKVSLMKEAELLELLESSTTIVKNKLKVKAVVSNAIAFLEVQKEFGTFFNYIWGFVNYTQINSKIDLESPRVTNNELSLQISKDLKKRGFKFLGPVSTYAYLQAIGIINDHIITCEQYESSINEHIE